jgi:hypothetical protein
MLRGFSFCAVKTAVKNNNKPNQSSNKHWSRPDRLNNQNPRRDSWVFLAVSEPDLHERTGLNSKVGI